ncbi:hypothetical protein [Oryza sativa Japonica Group]|uniref:Uncharacterized protein n=1 Tax=Oryza sativa subsp. japonica TaxID=39947 RepID=Q656U3_ORYSJ|nr:hypothetical protein [Oryza sativa Japonica Group]BAD45174.1 hypothetical protein [Oryza sativa Japonica Group]
MVSAKKKDGRTTESAGGKRVASFKWKANGVVWESGRRHGHLGPKIFRKYTEGGGTLYPHEATNLGHPAREEQPRLVTFRLSLQGISKGDNLFYAIDKAWILQYTIDKA